MNPGNAVVRLCADGMRAETEGRADDARELFERAWDLAADDYEACVAAHYLARHQTSPEGVLRWNQECLDRADRVGDDRVTGFYPSLHLNLGSAHRELGRTELAREQFVRVAARLDGLPPGEYATGMRFAVAEGLRATGGAPPRDTDSGLGELLARLCARADLKALGMILPAHLGDLGSRDDRVRLVTALGLVHAGRWLPQDEQDALGRVIGALG